ncbi:MAG: CAP domain-containing protein [Chloroflexi bacterium]|nr:CAP domain-containing protein [Chloroflexota bacterium]
MRHPVLPGVLALAVLIGSWLLAVPVEVAGAEPVIVTLARVTPAPVAAGQTADIEVTLTARVHRVATIDAVVADAGQAPIWQHAWSDQALRRGRSVSLATPWSPPADLPAGDYALVVQVRDEAGTPLTDTQVMPFAVTGAPVAPPTEVAEPTPPAVDADPEATALLALINDYRQAHGAPPLALQPQLAAAAAWHSQDMGEHGAVSHTDSLGRDPFQRMADFGYTANTWKGENIAAGYRGAAQVFAGWRSSSAHNDNMLSPDFHVIGIGRASVDGSRYGVYWTTTFGGE